MFLSYNILITTVIYSKLINSDENPYTKTLLIDIPTNGNPVILPGLSQINTSE
jgi:hypothetical protein